MDEYVKGRIDNYRDDLRTRLREEDIKYRRVVIEDNTVRLSFRDDATRASARGFINRAYNNEFLIREENDAEYFDLVLQITEQKIRESAPAAQPHPVRSPGYAG